MEAQVDAVTFETLEAEWLRVEDDLPHDLGLRMRRATSWIERAEKAADDDAAFIFYWIAFSAAFERDTSDQLDKTEAKITEFCAKILSHDAERRIHNLIMYRYHGAFKALLSNRYVFRPFWAYHNRQPGYRTRNWEKSFTHSMREFEAAFNAGNTCSVLITLFQRLYILRNQLMHGAATWNGSVNRRQVEDGAKIMASLIPLFVDIMLKNPDEKWGPPYYPVVDRQATGH